MTITFRSKPVTGLIYQTPLTPFAFPDGQAFIKVEPNFNPEAYAYHVAELRGHDPLDLFQLRMWSEALYNSGSIEPKIIIMPYLPGARSDHEDEIVFGAKVYAEFINECWADQIIILDPHSPVMPKLLEADIRPFHTEVTEFPFERIIRREIQDYTSDTRPAPYSGVIAPDHGAVDRATRAAKVMGVPVYKAGKTRDPQTGKLSGFHMEDELPTEGKLLIVDDICDGGGTFIGLAEATGLPQDRVDLWVTHGVFSKGAGVLADHFGQIHTTDSYFGTKPTFDGEDHVTVHHVGPYLSTAISTD